MAEADSDEATRRINAGMDSGAPMIYFNGFANALTLGDVTVVLEKNGRPVGVLNMSFTVAKTLAQKIGQAVASLEEMSGREMLTTDTLEDFAKKRGGQEK